VRVGADRFVDHASLGASLMSSLPQLPTLNPRVESAIEATSIRYNNRVYELREAGFDVTVLSLGEAYFDVPLERFDDLPFPAVYHYSHSRGLPELRSRLADHHRREHDVEINPATQLLVTAGSKAAIFMAMMAVLAPSDEVILQEPTWVSYPEQIKMLGAVPIMLPWNAPLESYARAVSPRTKLIIVNNPHNPRGEVMGQRALSYLLSLARRTGCFLLADEAYSDFAPESFVSLGALDRQFEHAIVCNSISKNLGISGWRLGYVFGHERVMSQVLKVNQHLITCPPTILQHYVAKHWESLHATCRPQIAALGQKRQAVGKLLEKHGLSALDGDSTFYFFVSIAPSRLSSEAFCTELLDTHHVCVVPGIGYGASCDDFVRVSFGTESLERIDAALAKIRALVDETSGQGARSGTHTQAEKAA
jgi:aminotransferase